ncbi:MAG: HEPN domain-containing protein [Candidatus Methanoperedens sp.]|nr:HEPN domain-containing protein [Candidatus Methanoperedens sp.]
MVLNNLDEIIDRWVGQADRDLENAKKNLDIEAYDVSLILCEQAAEKMLKALYIKERHEEPPRTHSLRKLIELTDMPDDALKLVAELDSYYLVLRYPDVGDMVPYENVDYEDAEDGIKKAEQIIELTKIQLQKGD